MTLWSDSWADVRWALIMGAMFHSTLVGVLWLSGRRTLGQLDAFAFIIVGLGSTLAIILLSSDVAYAEGLSALLLLAGPQFIVASVFARRPGTRNTITARPTALVVDGRLQRDELHRNQLPESEVLRAVRSTGAGDLSSLAAVVLGTNAKPGVTPTKSGITGYPGDVRWWLDPDGCELMGAT